MILMDMTVRSSHTLAAGPQQDCPPGSSGGPACHREIHRQACACFRFLFFSFSKAHHHGMHANKTLLLACRWAPAGLLTISAGGPACHRESRQQACASFHGEGHSLLYFFSQFEYLHWRFCFSLPAIAKAVKKHVPVFMLRVPCLRLIYPTPPYKSLRYRISW